MREVTLDLKSHQSLTLANDALTSISYTVEGESNLTIIAPKRTTGSVFLTISGNGTLNLRVAIEDDAQWSMLIMNQSEQQLDINEAFSLHRNATLQLAIGELSLGSHQKNTIYHLLAEGADLNVRGASLIQSKLKASYSALHYKGQTSAQIDNYSIVLKGCEYTLDIIGNIHKAARGAKTHQISRVMNFDEKPKTSVNPKLIIDENDVEASHAASVGQPDLNQVYYLQSRGLSRSESLKLITLGYLLPIIEVIDNEAIKERLSQEITKKVSESCLM